MTPFSIASIAATLLSLVLSVWLFATSSSAQGLQEELQKQQQELQAQNQLVQAQQQKLQAQQEQIQSANVLSQQVGPQVLQDLANRAVKNPKIEGLLSKYNLKVQEKPAAGEKPAPRASTP